MSENITIRARPGEECVPGRRTKERAKLEREALRLAVEDARARADAAASGAGRTVDRVLKIDAQTGGTPIPVPRVATFRGQAAADAAPPIEAGQMDIRAQVTLTSVLK